MSYNSLLFFSFSFYLREVIVFCSILQTLLRDQMLRSTHIYSFLFLSLAVHGGEKMYNQALLIPANLFNVSKASLKKKMPSRDHENAWFHYKQNSLLKRKQFFLWKQKGLSLEEMRCFFNCASHPGFWHGSPRDYSEQICDACKHPLACLNKNNKIEKLNKGSERDGSFLTTVSALLRRGAPEESCLCPLFRIILKEKKRKISKRNIFQKVQFFIRNKNYF